MSSRTVGLPESGWGAWLSSTALHHTWEVQALARVRPSSRGFDSRLATPLEGRAAPDLCPGPARDCVTAKSQGSFARLRVLPGPWWHYVHLEGSYPLFLAHMSPCAEPKPSRQLRLSLFHRVLAGCRQSLLGDGSSRRYCLCSMPGRLDPYPAVSYWCTCSFLPSRHRPLDNGNSIGSPDSSRNATSTRR